MLWPRGGPLGLRPSLERFRRRGWILAAAVVALAIAIAAQAMGAFEPRGSPRVARLPVSLEGRFYVSPGGRDSNPGTLRRPWRTIQHAMDALGPGQMAYIRAGTYTEGGRPNSLWWTRSGSASKPIVIRGYPGESKRVILRVRVKLEGDYLRLTDVVVERNRAYSDFDDAYTGDVGVWLAGAHDVLNHVEVRNSNMSGVLTSGHADSILASFIHDNGRHWNLDHGIYLGGSHQFVANNVIEGNLAYGVHIWPSCNACIVTSNTLVHNHRSGVLVGGDARGTRIVNNISAFNAEYGFRLFELSGDDNESLNNLAYGNAGGGYCSDECGGGMTVIYELNADPMFVSNTRDFHLRRRSPAVDAGLGSYAPATDFSGRPRPKGAAPDLGAYERQDR